MSNTIITLIITLTNSLINVHGRLTLRFLTDIANHMYLRNVGFINTLLQKDGFKWPCMWSSLGGKWRPGIHLQIKN